MSTGGKAVFSTWEPVSECRASGVICEALIELVAESSNGVTNMGSMVSNVLVAEKTG